MKQRIAIIDLGTNSIRFDIHEFHPRKKSLVCIHREKRLLQFGQDLYLSGRLHPAAQRRALVALKSFTKKARQLGVLQLDVFATSALRDAGNRLEFIRKVKVELGLKITVISGMKEARLIARGVLENEANLPKEFAIVDLGGGSTEIIWCKNKTVVKSMSLKLGSARLYQLFLKALPPSPLQVDQLRIHIGMTLGRALARAFKGEEPRAKTILGSSGSVRAISAVAELAARDSKKNQAQKVSHRQLHHFGKSLCKMKLSQLRQLSTVKPQREEFLPPSVVLLDEIARHLGAKKLQSTYYSLRDGLISEELAQQAKKVISD